MIGFCLETCLGENLISRLDNVKPAGSTGRGWSRDSIAGYDRRRLRPTVKYSACDTEPG